MFFVFLLKFQERLIRQNLSIIFIREFKLPDEPQISVWREALRIVQSLTYNGKPCTGIGQKFDESFKVLSGLWIGPILNGHTAANGWYVVWHLFIVFFVVMLQSEAYVIDFIFLISLKVFSSLFNFMFGLRFKLLDRGTKLGPLLWSFWFQLYWSWLWIEQTALLKIDYQFLRGWFQSVQIFSWLVY